jgi:hypothetical protein
LEAVHFFPGRNISANTTYIAAYFDSGHATTVSFSPVAGG